MFQLNSPKLAISFVFCLLLSAANVLGFTCPLILKAVNIRVVSSTMTQSTVVFTGKVIGFEWRKHTPEKFIASGEKDSNIQQINYERMVVRFLVEKWWKGNAASEIFLSTSRVKYPDGAGGNTSCDYKFRESETYLVYAAIGKEGELRTNSCAGTKPLSGAKEDLQILGEGKEPIENKKVPY